MKKTRVNVSSMTILSAILLLFPPALANETATDQAKKMDSIRTVRAEKVSAFRAAFPNVWVETNPVTGGPEDLWGDLSKNQAKTEQLEAAYEFFEQNKELYGITNPREELKLQSNAKDEYGGMVNFKQLYNGVEIYRSTLRAYFTPAGKLKGIKGGFLTNINVVTTPSIDSNSAVGIVKQDLKLPMDYKDTLREYSDSIRGVPNSRRRSLPSARLAVYSSKGKHHLAWVVWMPMSWSWTSWEYFVDAHTGQIIHRENTAILENPHSRPSEKPRPVKESVPLNPPVEKYEWPYPPRIETVKTAPQMVPELYQKLQDSVRKLEEKAWEEEARRHNMSPADYLKYREDEEVRRSLEAAAKAGIPPGYQPAPGTPEVKRPVPPATTEARKPVMLIDSTGRDTVIIKFRDSSEIPESLRIESDRALEIEMKKRERLRKTKEPRSEEETSSYQSGAQKAVVQTAFIYDAFWVGIARDCDGDFYNSLARLAWEPGLNPCGTTESLLVYEKFYVRRTGSANWIFAEQTSPYHIVDCNATNIRKYWVQMLSGNPNYGYLDFRIEIYRSDQMTYDHYRDPFNDGHLYSNPFETEEADQCFRAKIHNVWWELENDCDFDGYVSSAQLTWDPDVVGCEGNPSVYEKIYYKPAASGTWNLYTTTFLHSITGCSKFDFQSISVQDFNQGLYDWKIEIYRNGQSIPDTSANPSNDPDLNDKKLELSSQDICAVTIANAWWTGTNDCDRDGYYSAATLNWDPNTGGCSTDPLQVYEKIYYKPFSSGTWTLYYTTSSHPISGCTNADAQSLVIPDNIHPNNFYDWKIELYGIGQGSPGYVQSFANDPDLYQYKMETVSQDPCTPFAKIEDAWWSNEVDCDDDGYKSVTRLNWNPEVLGCGGQLAVYEWIWRKEVGTSTWLPFGQTNNHTIIGCSGSDIQVMDIQNPFGHKLYDWKIEIFRVNETVPDYVRDFSNDLDLGNYGMEAISLDPCLQPDLTYFTPADWDSFIVVSNQPSTNTQSQPTHSKYAYIDFALINQGLRGTENSFISRIFIDNAYVGDAIFPPLQRSYLATHIDYPHAFTTTGTHWVKVVHDFNNEVIESDETNNVCSLKVIVKCLPDFPVGIGAGVLGDDKNHIDTDCLRDIAGLSDTIYVLLDSTRSLTNNPHGHNGKMVSYSNISTQKWRSNGPPLPIVDKGNVWTDSAQASGVDAHVYAGWTYDYLLSKLKEKALDSLSEYGLLIRVEIDTPYVDQAAYEHPDLLKVYASSDTMYSFAAGLDVIAHEWGHGMMAFTSRLAPSYHGETAALWESFPDMFAVSVGFTFTDRDWEIGDDVFKTGPNRLRDLSDPKRKGHPDTYTDSLRTFLSNCDPDCHPVTGNDCCDRHKNCGVPNKMFYLYAAGGNHNGINVTGIGIDDAMKVIYRAQDRRYWDDSIKFVRAMYASLQAAAELSPDSVYGMKFRELLKAWEAVKVCVPNGNADGSGSAPDNVDIVLLVNFTFFGAPAVDWCASDLNCDGTYSASDVVGLIRMVYFRASNLCPYTS